MNHIVLRRTNDDHIYWCTVVPCLTELKDLPNGDRYRLFKIHIVKSIYQIYDFECRQVYSGNCFSEKLAKQRSKMVH